MAETLGSSGPGARENKPQPIVWTPPTGLARPAAVRKAWPEDKYTVKLPASYVPGVHRFKRPSSGEGPGEGASPASTWAPAHGRPAKRAAIDARRPAPGGAFNGGGGDPQGGNAVRAALAAPVPLPSLKPALAARLSLGKAGNGAAAVAASPGRARVVSVAAPSARPAAPPSKQAKPKQAAVLRAPPLALEDKLALPLEVVMRRKPR